jgi:hypothetical protein
LSCDTATGDEYGFLAEILGFDEYDHQTGIDTYVNKGKPDTYDPAITVATPTHMQKQLEKSGNIPAPAGTFKRDS